MIDAKNAILKWWESRTFILRFLVLTLWPAGCIIMAIGLEGDGDGWWNNHPFLGNLATSAVGACFGIPFALLILQYIIEHQSQITERRKALTMYSQRVEELRSVVALMDSHTYDRDEFEKCREKIAWATDNLEPLTRDDLVDYLKELESQLFWLLLHLDSNKNLAHSTYIYKSTWDTLHIGVKDRLENAGVPWPMNFKKGISGLDINTELKNLEDALPKIKKLRRIVRDVKKIRKTATHISLAPGEDNKPSLADLKGETANLAVDALDCLNATETFVFIWPRLRDQTWKVRQAYVEYIRSSDLHRRGNPTSRRNRPPTPGTARGRLHSRNERAESAWCSIWLMAGRSSQAAVLLANTRLSGLLAALR